MLRIHWQQGREVSSGSGGGQKRQIGNMDNHRSSSTQPANNPPVYVALANKGGYNVVNLEKKKNQLQDLIIFLWFGWLAYGAQWWDRKGSVISNSFSWNMLSKDCYSIAATDNKTFRWSHWTVIRTSSTVYGRRKIDDRSQVYPPQPIYGKK